MESKFDVRVASLVARVRHTLAFAGFVAVTFFAWLVFGARVRRAYRKARREGRRFCVDHLPVGRKPP
ncbi:MAG: hypothetical protein HKO62_01360 [Gammaproteobacteria bacterium]|nr:hypothetical protein [Gammaproteobacteria bacterium]NNL99366.1 hypothetical protein [Gammaproteobacteria bacterium]